MRIVATSQHSIRYIQQRHVMGMWQAHTRTETSSCASPPTVHPQLIPAFRSIFPSTRLLRVSCCMWAKTGAGLSSVIDTVNSDTSPHAICTDEVI